MVLTCMAMLPIVSDEYLRHFALNSPLYTRSFSCLKHGAGEGDRTRDLLFTNLKPRVSIRLTTLMDLGLRACIVLLRLRSPSESRSVRGHQWTLASKRPRRPKSARLFRA